VTVNLEKNGDCDVLELNVVLSEPEAPRSAPTLASPSFGR